MTANGTSLSYCGYIGSSADEQGRGIAVDSCGKAYVAGLTWSDQSTSPVTGGPDLTYNGDQGISGSGDAFVAKVAAALDPPAMLQQLGSFMSAPTTGTVDPAVAASLTADVNAASAAWAKGNESAKMVAANNLNAPVNHVNVQTGKKIGTTAAASIISQPN